MRLKGADELFEAVEKGKLLSATLSSPKKTQNDRPLRISVRPVKIKNKLFFQVTEHYSQQVLHRNISAKECVTLFQENLSNAFRQGVFTTFKSHYHILVNREGQMSVIKKESKQENSLEITHNKPKNYLLEEGVPTPFLISLGIMRADGQIIAKKYDKFRQINRFVELVRDVLPHLPTDRKIEIIDYGCGKASLTFALYHYLKHIEKRDIHIVGLDLKKEVIEGCQTLADKLGYSDLEFKVGDINSHNPDGKVDMVISLHACDTATDAALEKAVKWDADIILCVPCCQHELFNQVQNENLNSLLRHGILRERFAALATDAARAEILTMHGYEVQILEFIDMEHTPKNLMIRAIKKSPTTQARTAETRYKKFKSALGIFPSFEKMVNHL